MALIAGDRRPISFPALETLFCSGFVPFLEYIDAPRINDLELQAFSCEVMEWKRFHSQFIPLSVQRLTLSFMELRPPTTDDLNNNSYSSLTWLRLHHIGIVGPVQPLIRVPNLHSLYLERNESEMSIPWETGLDLGHVLTPSGILGSIDNLQHLEIKNISLSKDGPRSPAGFHHLYYHKHLVSLRIQDSSLPPGFIALLLETGKKEDSFLAKLKELSLVECECEYSLPTLKALLAANRPQLSVTGSLYPVLASPE
jgi:hypothetical protein